MSDFLKMILCIICGVVLHVQYMVQQRKLKMIDSPTNSLRTTNI